PSTCLASCARMATWVRVGTREPLSFVLVLLLLSSLRCLQSCRIHLHFAGKGSFPLGDRLAGIRPLSCLLQPQQGLCHPLLGQLYPQQWRRGLPFMEPTCFRSAPHALRCLRHIWTVACLCLGCLTTVHSCWTSRPRAGAERQHLLGEWQRQPTLTAPLADQLAEVSARQRLLGLQGLEGGQRLSQRAREGPAPPVGMLQRHPADEVAKLSAVEHRHLGTALLVADQPSGLSGGPCSQYSRRDQSVQQGSEARGSWRGYAASRRRGCGGSRSGL